MSCSWKKIPPEIDYNDPDKAPVGTTLRSRAKEGSDIRIIKSTDRIQLVRTDTDTFNPYP